MKILATQDCAVMLVITGITHLQYVCIDSLLSEVLVVYKKV
jgi:hypothetical protein